MGTIFLKIIEISMAASFLILLVILLRLPLKKAPKWFMGVLWAMVALRLMMPFQIESKIGFLPNFSGIIENYINTKTGAIPEVTYHDYTPSVGAATIGQGSSNGSFQSGTPSGGEEIDYLPNEQIIVAPAQMTGLFGIDNWNEIFIRLQMIWLFGMIIVFWYAAFSFISIKKKTSASIRLTTCEKIKYQVSSGSRFENSSNERIFVCDEIDTPFILGIFKPAIYLPSGLDEETTRNVLAHEKAHIRRGDHLRKQLGFLLLAIHWFNPLVWISYMLFCKDIELACDEKVISHMSLDEKKSYATSLLLCSTHQRLILAYPLAFGEVGVGTRVKQIFNYKKPTFWLIVLLVIVTGALSTCFLTSGAKDITVSDGDKFEEVEAKFKAEETNIENGEDAALWDFLENWHQNFMDRNAEGIIEACSEEVKQKLIDDDLLFISEDGAGFGWSSPWPGNLYEQKSALSTIGFTKTDKIKAEIHYYATDSEPHAYVWKENLEIEEDENAGYKVVSEEITMYDDISTFEDFKKAYFYSSTDNEHMDYQRNGLGEYLNNNAKNDTNGLYTDLFDPVKSARYLLNLTSDETKVSVSLGQSKTGAAEVGIIFADDNQLVTITMVRPWGEDGIYVPVMRMPKNNSKTNGFDLTDDAYTNDEEVSYEIEGQENTEDNNDNDLLYTNETDKKLITLPYSDVSSYFENIHEHESMQDEYTQEVDINKDGDNEKIIVENLGLNGGDGGYLPHVYASDGKEIVLPDNVSEKPFLVVWVDGKAEIFFEDVCIGALSKEQVKELYIEKGYTEDELNDLQDSFDSTEVIEGDSASGFTVKEDAFSDDLIVKYLISGKEGHSDTFGYGLIHLKLNNDGTWNERAEFVLDASPHR